MYLFQFLLLSGYQPITFYWSKVTFGRLNIKSQKWSPKEPTQSEKAWALVVQTIKDNCLSGIPEQRKGQQQIDFQFRNFVGTFPLQWHEPWSALVTSAVWAVSRLTRAGHRPLPRPPGEDVTWTRRAASPWTRYSAASPPPSPRSTHGPSSTRCVLLQTKFLELELEL